MTRWGVERIRYRSWITGEIILGEGWQVIAPDGYVIHTEYTWHAAMRYADTQARTVEVVLPRGRKTEIKSQEPWDGFDDMTTDSFGEYLTIYWPDDWLIIAPYECKPLALALLAHHYKQEGA